MKALRVVLLVLLISGQSGSRWAQEEDGDADLGSENYGYDDDYEEEEEEETNMIPGSRDRESLQCYMCLSLHSGESCNETQSCYHSHTFCTTLVSHGNTAFSLAYGHEGPEDLPSSYQDTLAPSPTTSFRE
ncbi:Glycosylphosphatidylinositol-anchored high density lipoprotein-binding protein 1 [Lemmus lemmus]